tara:strand:+ start:232 stop:528 length:297 start_codon:yes stop_codon:yes gene_type:complete
MLLLVTVLVIGIGVGVEIVRVVIEAGVKVSVSEQLISLAHSVITSKVIVLLEEMLEMVEMVEVVLRDRVQQTLVSMMAKPVVTVATAEIVVPAQTVIQ